MTWPCPSGAHGLTMPCLLAQETPCRPLSSETAAVATRERPPGLVCFFSPVRNTGYYRLISSASPYKGMRGRLQTVSLVPHASLFLSYLVSLCFTVSRAHHTSS